MKNTDIESLSDEELADIADENSDAMCILIERYSKLIRYKADVLAGSAEADDLAQEGFLGLLTAASGYDPRRNVKFSTYAGRCITNRMISALRKNSSVPTPVGDITEPVFETADTDALPDSIVEYREERLGIWQKMISQLSSLEYQICMMSMGGSDYARIAKKLGVSVKSVDNAIQRIRRKLKA